MQPVTAHPGLARRILSAAVAAAIFPSAAVATGEIRLPRIDVVGATDQLAADNPGSVAVITEQELEDRVPLSTQDALRKVPGVNVVETDGYGFSPRIGIRGLNPDMSKKVLLLEDGAPIALGPYTDPATYYHPPIERMERIEVLKGSSSLRYGPSTIGGAINYVTRQPPVTPGGMVDLRAGSRDYRSVQAEYGGAVGDAVGSVSFLHKEGDGFRDMPFEVNDLVLKGGLGLGDKQFLGAKLTYYRQDATHTYLGLTQKEFDEDPDQNRADGDRMEVRRWSVDVNHEYAISPTATLKTLFYYNQARRDWWRENFAFDTSTGENAMLGQEQGRLRDFEVMGVDSRLAFAHRGFGIDNDAELGIRLHGEEMDNRRTNNAPVGSHTVTPILREDDTRRARAVALFAENRFHVSDAVTVTPGLRVERYVQERSIDQWNSVPVGTDTTTRNTEVVPGLGATWQVNPGTTLYAGVHRGFAPPRVQDAVSNDGTAVELDAERSTNYEVGARGRQGVVAYEITWFRLDFANQLVQASQAGGASSQLTNAGESLNEGLEVGGDIDLGGGFSIGGNYTWLPTARLESTRIIGGVDRKGNRLPYAPEHLLNASLRYAAGPVRVGLSANYVSEQFSDFENTRAGSADGKRGEIEARTVWDLSASYQLTAKTRLYGTVKNLTDKKYIASRAPEGIFPGIERTVQVGLQVDL